MHRLVILHLLPCGSVEILDDAYYASRYLPMSTLACAESFDNIGWRCRYAYRFIPIIISCADASCRISITSCRRSHRHAELHFSSQQRYLTPLEEASLGLSSSQTACSHCLYLLAPNEVCKRRYRESTRPRARLIMSNTRRII